MNPLEFSFADIPLAVSSLVQFIKENSVLCGVLFMSYILYYIYLFIHNTSVDSDIYEVDMLSAGISSFMVAMLLVGLNESSHGFSLSSIDISSPTTKIALFLSAYALMLVLLAFLKVLPKFLVVVLGNSELDLFINLNAALLTDPEFALTGTVLFVIGVPLLVLFILQRLRRLMS